MEDVKNIIIKNMHPITEHPQREDDYIVIVFWEGKIRDIMDIHWTSGGWNTRKDKWINKIDFAASDRMFRKNGVEHQTYWADKEEICVEF